MLARQPNEEWFAAVPHCEGHRRLAKTAVPPGNDPMGWAESGYWFLVPWRNRTRSKKATSIADPVAAVHLDGLLWVGKDPPVNLDELYASHRRDFASYMDGVVSLFGDRLEFLT